MVQIEEDILGKNNQYAAANRRRFGEQGILALNLVSSPGSGKTTLLVRTIESLAPDLELTASTLLEVCTADQAASPRRESWRFP